MSRSYAQIPTKQGPAAPSTTELQQQLADSEGMAPRGKPKPQPVKSAGNEGEGNRTADRNYRRGVKHYLVSGRSDEAADEAARAIDTDETEELRHAEQQGKAGQHH